MSIFKDTFSLNNKKPKIIPQTIVMDLFAMAVEREKRFKTCCHNNA